MKPCKAIKHVAAIVRNSGTSFYWAMRILPVKKRDAIYAVYAFCREVDDIADNPGSEQGKLRQLSDWRMEIERLFEGKPQSPISIALNNPIKQFSLCRNCLLYTSPSPRDRG